MFFSHEPMFIFKHVFSKYVRKKNGSYLDSGLEGLYMCQTMVVICNFVLATQKPVAVDMNISINVEL